MITGGHGGTELEEKLGFVTGFILNTGVYFVMIAGILLLRNRRKNKGTP